MRINNNIPSLNTHRIMKLTNGYISKNMERLSSGLRINRAGDDAAGMSISEKMRAQIRGLNMASRNSADGISLIRTAEGGLNEVSSILQRMRELAVQAANGTMTLDDRNIIDKEIGQLSEEIDRIACDTEFNTLNVLGPSRDKENPPEPNLEIVFLIDDSGSMDFSKEGIAGEGELKNLKLGISSFVDNLPQGTKVGAISIADGQRHLDLTSDKNTIVDHIQNFNADKGAVDPFEYISSGVNGGFSWSQNSKRAYVLITDTGNEDFSETRTEQDIIDILKCDPNDANDDIALFVFNTKESQTTEDTYRNIVDQTNGSIYTTSDPDEVKNILTNDLISDLNDVVDSGSENDKSVQDIILQIGSNEGQILEFQTSDVRAVVLGVDNLDMLTYEGTQEALEKIDNAIAIVSSERSRYGAIQNRLEHTISNLDNSAENLQAAESRIRDSDIAKEMVSLSKYQILLQASQAMMAQTNQMSQGVLQLLK